MYTIFVRRLMIVDMEGKSIQEFWAIQMNTCRPTRQFIYVYYAHAMVPDNRDSCICPSSYS